VIGSQIYRYRKVSGLVEKQQTKWVVIGLTISLGTFLLVILVASFIYTAELPPLVNGALSIAITILFGLIPVWIGIAITRYRLWDVEVIINRALIYGPLSAILAGIFAASVVVINGLARELFGEDATTTAGVVSALVIASIFQPLRSGLEKWINVRFYPESIDLHREFVEFSPEIRSVIKLKDLLRIVAAKTAGLVNVRHAAVLLARKGGSYRRVQAHPTARGVASLKPNKKLQAELDKGRAVSKGEQQGLLVPIYLKRIRKHDVIGILDIGPRINRTGFSSDDKKALAQLGAEIGTSIYTAQLRAKDPNG
jgi:hypothetical protein